ESIRRIRREFSKQLAEASAEEVVRIALNLARRSEIQYRFFAYELVHHHGQALRSLRTRSLEELGKGIESWSTVDCFACYLAGPAWRENQVPDTLIKRWTRSKDHWWRRAALVSTVPLNSKARGGKGDVRRTLEICELLVDDREDMVVKALSWALRELAKRNPESVYDFLARYEGKLASRVSREVKNKLHTGLKNARRAKA
ncbi:MAG TPA: DNA alkylation repair protein, partial [Pyrinomonadaceae bacterium]|nr:DNA alkylation repair protein [Pyrinomonadaceae bacterium]